VRADRAHAHVRHCADLGTAGEVDAWGRIEDLARRVGVLVIRPPAAQRRRYLDAYAARLDDVGRIVRLYRNRDDALEDLLALAAEARVRRG
jgi:hypothetical protein